MTKYFADELKNQTDENLKNQTIRNMLNMQTAKGPRWGLSPETPDRVRFYFEHDGEKSRPGGHSWGDSAMMCTPKDLLLIARFCMNYGAWDGEQILNEKFMKDAVSKLMVAKCKT